MDTGLRDSPVSVTVDGHVATVMLDEPERRNPLSPRMLRGILAALADVDADPRVRVLVLTGAGDRAFCAGADLSSFGAGDDSPERHAERGLFADVFLAMDALAKPIVGCVNGHALAGGFGLALACDVLVAADTATFGTPEINVGLWPMMVTALVVRNLGRKRAMHLFLTGDRISAATASEWGLLHSVVAPEEVRTAAAQLAHRIATRSPAVLRLGRNAFSAVDGMGYEPALRHLQAQLTAVAMTDDAREGIDAFLQKREARFTGH